MTEDSVELARAATAGAATGFADVIRRTQTDVWRVCAYLVDQQSADDLTQDTYLRAYRAVHTFRGEAPLLTWLLSIARRVCAAEISRRQRAHDLSLQLHAETVEAVVPDSSYRIDIDLLIAGLEPDRRLAFVLTQVIGCDYAEAAAISGCPIGTIRSRVARARDDLIRHLGERQLAARGDTRAN